MAPESLSTPEIPASVRPYHRRVAAMSQMTVRSTLLNASCRGGGKTGSYERPVKVQLMSSTAAAGVDAVKLGRQSG